MGNSILKNEWKKILVSKVIDFFVCFYFQIFGFYIKLFNILKFCLRDEKKKRKFFIVLFEIRLIRKEKYLQVTSKSCVYKCFLH